LILLLEQTFKRPKITDIKHSLKIILTRIPDVSEKDLKEFETISRTFLNKSISSKSKDALIKNLEMTKQSLFLWCQKITADFVLKNRAVAIY
jgi:hypothetical protein